MFRILQNNLAIWMRAVIVTAAVMALIASAFVTAPEIHHRVLPTQIAVTSAVDTGGADDGFTQNSAEKNCHVGHSCLLAIIPNSDLALTRSDRSPETPRLTGAKPSGAGYMPFHPPRLLSLV